MSLTSVREPKFVSLISKSGRMEGKKMQTVLSSATGIAILYSHGKPNNNQCSRSEKEEGCPFLPYPIPILTKENQEPEPLWLEKTIRYPRLSPEVTDQ